MPARKDPFHELCQYWEVTDAENPTFRDIYDQHTEGILQLSRDYFYDRFNVS